MHGVNRFAKALLVLLPRCCYDAGMKTAETLVPPSIAPLLEAALAEDIGPGDITGNAVIPEGMQATLSMRARAAITVCGLVYLPELFARISPSVTVELQAREGEAVAAGATLATLHGPARALLAGERTALNLVQQLSGVATLAARYVAAVAGTRARILDTRKTIPGLRALQKYAVRCGGGQNHRMGLHDAVLIKDNHIAIAGGVRAAVEAVQASLQAERGNPGISAGLRCSARNDVPLLEVECDTLAQLDEALACGVARVLLDNMDPVTLAEGVRRAHAKGAEVEASGNVSLETVAAIAATGVDFISVGKLTHSAPAVDIGLDEA